MSQHSIDLHALREGDTADLTMSDGEEFEVEVEDYQHQHAAEMTGEVRDTYIWTFVTEDLRFAVSITDGLASSPDDPEFPIHHEVWDMKREETMGFVEECSNYVTEA